MEDFSVTSTAASGTTKTMNTIVGTQANTQPLSPKRKEALKSTSSLLYSGLKDAGSRIYNALTTVGLLTGATAASIPQAPSPNRVDQEAEKHKEETHTEQIHWGTGLLERSVRDIVSVRGITSFKA